MSDEDYASKMGIETQARAARSEAFWGADPVIRALHPLSLPPHPSDEFDDWKRKKTRATQSRAARAGYIGSE